MKLRALIGLLGALVLSLWAGLAMAQSLVPSTGGGGETVATPALPDPLTEEAVNALVSRLSDAEVRALLLAQINAPPALSPEDADEELEGLLQTIIYGGFSSIQTAVERLPILFSEQAKAFRNFATFLGPNGLWQLAGYFALVFLGALAVELIFRRVVRRWLVLPEVAGVAMRLRDALTPLGKRLVGEVGAVALFLVAAAAINHTVVPEHFRPFIALVGPWLIGLPRMGVAIARFLMAPNAPAYRLVHGTTDTAKAMVFHMFWFCLLIGIGAVIVPFNAANGVPPGETRIGFWVNLSVHLYAAVWVWRYWTPTVDMMRGSDPDVSPIEDRIARAYPYFGIAVALGTWWVVNVVASTGNFALLSSAPHYKTMGVLMFAPAMDTAIRGLVRHLVPPMTGEGPIAERAHYATKRSYIRIGRVIVFAIVLIAIAGFWGMDPESLATAGVGERFAVQFLEFLMLISAGYLVYELVSLIINRKLAAEQTAAGHDPNEDEIGGEGGGAGGSRLSTVLPLILGTARISIIVIFALLALGAIGVDTTPLLAGAGIVGLAIGFGAQKLVTDVVSGIFFLVDDAFRTGEYVEVDGTMGTVEKISIRSMQLRHHRGPVHTLPYGEIPKITNYSRDWVIMKLRFTVPFGTDPNKVKKIFKKIGAEMLEDPLFKDDFLQPFKSQGVLEFDDVGIVMRGKFMAKPGTQFTIRKELLTRVNRAFDENGIDFARREVRVAIPGLDDADKLDAEGKAALAGAAAEAAQTVIDQNAAAAQGGSGAGKPGD